MMMNLPCLRGSCPNFVRPIYHTLSAGQAPKRGHAPRIKPMPATALVFLFDCYWPAFTCHGTDSISGRYTTTDSCWFLADAVPFRLHRLRVSLPEPCPVSNAYDQWLDRVLEYIAHFYFLCRHLGRCSFRAFDILQHFLRIICCPRLQDCVDHP